MIKLTHLELPPDEALADLLQLICVRDFSELSALPLPASNPLQALYQYVLGFELHRYFARMEQAHHAKPRLLCAFDQEQTLKGYALYLPYYDSHQACALLKLWVAKASRKQGLGRQLVDAIVMRYPQLQVACRADQASYFHQLGLHPLYAHGPQVLLSTHPEPCTASLALEPLEPIFASKQAQAIQQYLLKQHGVSAIKYAYQQRDRLLKKLAQEANNWIAEHSLR